MAKQASRKKSKWPKPRPLASSKLTILLFTCLFAIIGAILLLRSRAASTLSWAPPSDYENYQKIYVTDSNNFLSLDPSLDYQLVLPGRPGNPQTTPLKGSGQQNRGNSTALTVKGGHNIVIIGGHITIPTQDIPVWGTTGTGPRSGFTDDQMKTGISMRRAGNFIGITGTLHIEGILVDGADLAEGFQFAMPNGIVQAENIRMENMHARDETSFTDNHPDHFDLYGGVKEIRVDGFTGETDYQSFKLKPDPYVSIGKFTGKNINIRPLPSSQGRYYFWSTDGTTVYDAQSFQNVWAVPGGARALKDVFYHPNFVTTKTDSQGEYLQFSSALLTGSIRRGIPPTGDMVASGVAGMSYASPGYGGTTTPPATGTVSLTGVTGGQTVSGSITVQAQPSNATNITQIAFYMDGVLLKRADGTDAIEKGAPYCMYGDDGTNCYPYDTTKLTNGNHTIKAVMTYNSGANTAETSVSFTVSNGATTTPPPPPSGDTTAPTAPTNLRVIATAQRSISLSWTASTDNVGVTEYCIYRNGTTDNDRLVCGITGTAYTDNAARPNKQYIYYVTARDAAGNESGFSNGQTARTGK